MVAGGQMARVRLVLGAVGPDSVRGLVLSDAALEPTVEIRHLDGSSLPVPLTAGTDAIKFLPAQQLGAVAAKVQQALQPVRVYHFHQNGLAAGQTHSIRAAAGEAASATGFQTLDPAAERLSIVVASCHYEFFEDGPRYAAVLATWAEAQRAAFKLLVGDNLYLDVHGRQGDKSLADGYLENAWVYLQYWWESDSYAKVLATLPSFTTFDDHEFWNNYPEEQKWLSRSRAPLRPGYLEAGTAFLDVFQTGLNPDPDPTTGGRNYRIAGAPLVDFYVADMRSRREVYRRGARMMPPQALADLVAWAKGLGRPGVLVLGQPLVIGAGGKTDYTPPDFSEEYEAIWQAIADCDYDILVLSGDVHHSRALALTLPGNPRRPDRIGTQMVYEIVTSPASHIPTVAATATGTYGVQGRASVEFPEEPKYSDGGVRVARYVFGTDAKATIAVLTFTKHGDSVRVGGTFLDLATGQPATAWPANTGFLNSGRRPELTRCESTELFFLRRRGT